MKQFRHAVTMVLVFLAMLLASGCGSSGTSGGLSFTWKNYAHLTNTPTARPWVVLMCKFSDVSDEPAGLFQEAKEFLTPLGHLTGNMADYWSDVSYGAITIAGSEVHGWYTAPYAFAKLSEFGKKYGKSARYEKVQQCADQVPTSDVDFSQFFGVIVVLNKVNDGGACGTSSVVEQGHHLACVLFDANSFYTAFAAQEMGHGYGLAHSSDETHAQYADPFDVMSTLGANMFQGCNYMPLGQTCPNGNSGGWDGPGLNVPNLLALGWIPPKRVATYFIYGGLPQVVTLAALSHPEASGDLALLVEDPFDPSKLYTVEFRTPDGWDQGFGTAGVYIHQYTPVPLDAVTLYSFLQKKGTHGGQLFAGDSWSGTSWSGPSTSWRVDVLSIGRTTATIQIHTVSGGGLVGDEPIVQIQAPANGSHVTAGAPFQLVARATTSSGTPLPSSAVVWTANGTQIGTGATLTTSLSAAGSPYTITVTGTDSSQHLSASASITLYVDPPATPPPAPTAQILSPTPGQSYRIPQGGSFQIVLSASASAGVTQYAWSDALHLFTDSKANDTVTISQQQVGCQSETDTIQLTVKDSHGDTGTATPVTITLDPQCIQ